MTPLCSTVAVGILSLIPDAPSRSRTIAGREVHAFRVTVPAGQFVTAVLDQGDTDLTVTVCGPDGKTVGRFDGRDRGVDATSFVAAAPGAYRVLVVPAKASSP